MALLLITALAWAWLLHLSGQMNAAPADMADMDMSSMPGDGHQRHARWRHVAHS